GSVVISTSSLIGPMGPMGLPGWSTSDFCRSISDFSCMEHEPAWSSLISSRAISRHNLVGVHDETPAVHAVHAPSIDLREVKAGPPRTMLRPDQPILTHRAVVSGHAHDTPADSAEPLPKLLGRDVPILVPSHAHEELLEHRRIETYGRLARLFNEAGGQVGHVEVNLVAQPQAEQLADVREFRILRPAGVHARDRVRLPQPYERTTDHRRPLRITSEWSANPRRSRRQVGADDRQSRGDVAPAISCHLLQRVPPEGP